MKKKREKIRASEKRVHRPNISVETFSLPIAAQN